MFCPLKRWLIVLSSVWLLEYVHLLQMGMKDWIQFSFIVWNHIFKPDVNMSKALLNHIEQAQNLIP